MKLIFSHASLTMLWEEAMRQWAVEVRRLHGQRCPGFWLVGDKGLYLVHNGAKSSATYARECHPLKAPSQKWLELKRAIFEDKGGMEFIEPIFIGTAVDAQCDIEISFEDEVMTIVVLEKGQASIRWQTTRQRRALRPAVERTAR